MRPTPCDIGHNLHLVQCLATRFQMISPEFMESSRCQRLDVGKEREARVPLHAQPAGRVIDTEWMGAHERAQPFPFERFGRLKAAVVQQAVREGRCIRDIVIDRGHLEAGDLNAAQLDEALDLLAMTRAPTAR
jgi:hypothetical protein